MTIKELVKHIATFEGKKHEASVSDIREIVGILSDLAFVSPSIGLSLYDNGNRRAKKKGKK